MRVLNAARDFNAPISPTIYLENHDHATITYEPVSDREHR
jgi:hypothetical protein